MELKHILGIAQIVCLLLMFGGFAIKDEQIRFIVTTIGFVGYLAGFIYHHATKEEE